MAKKTDADPAGLRDIRVRTTRRFNIRLDQARREVVALFRKIPRSRRQVTKIVNEVQAVYDYDIAPEQLESLNAEIRRIVDMLLLETQNDTIAINWWYKPEVEQPVRKGTLETTNEFNQLIALAITLGMSGLGGMEPQRIAPELILSSNQYLTSLRNVYAENFQVIKTLSNKTAGQVIQRINSGINAGLTPSQIAKDISERFNVAKANAQRIANTEVQKAHNNAKIKATKTAGEVSGLRSAVRHISALLPTTRKHHAARHFKVYTVEDQMAWWDSGVNRINCYCTIRSVLIDKKGIPVEA